MSNSIPEGHDVTAYYVKFRRASSEETLDLMYNRALDKAKETFSGIVLTQVQCEIMRALDKRQVDFDSTAKGMQQKINHIQKQSTFVGQGIKADASPEDEMGRLLRELSK